ncbi:hypothetical protein FACS189434_07020 [Bacteroidia bacterium]|nr:hypothetical protein FACS189434_07020 [Bacteroidia bacterium]
MKLNITVSDIFMIVFVVVIIGIKLLQIIDVFYPLKKVKTKQTADFMKVLMILSSAVIKADRAVLSVELDYVRNFFKHQFGEEKTEQYIAMLKEMATKEYDLRIICTQARGYMNMAYRLQLLHYLFGVAYSDGEMNDAEYRQIYNIAYYLRIDTADFYSIKAMYVRTPTKDSNYTILEVQKDATNDEIKRAYKRMAVKYHPDKVAHLGADVQKAANEKFQKINAAYEAVKRERGIT